MEHQSHSGLGMGYYKLRLVDRDRSCRNAYLGDPVAVPPGLENGREPCCRGNDDLCRDVRWPVPYMAHGKSVDGVFHLTISKHPWSCLAKLCFGVNVGRVCHLYVLH